MRKTMIGLAWIVLACASAPAEEPFHDVSFDAACKLAKDGNKVVMIDFYTTWCGPCKMLDRLTWPDGKVRAFLKEKTIAVKVDAERNRELSGRFAIVAYPTLVFVKPDGKEVGRIRGYLDPPEFLRQAAGVLAGKDPVALARERMGAAGQNNPLERINQGRALAQAGKFKEALDEYLWCYDHGLESGAGFYGVRLSFLPHEIHQLARQYRPALDALLARRSAAEKAMYLAADKKPLGEDAGGRAMFGDPREMAAAEFAALNRELGEPEKTLVAFDRLKAEGPATASARQALFRDVLDPLIERKRYQDVVDQAGPSSRAVDRAIQMYQGQRQAAVRQRIPVDPRLEARARQSVVVEGGKYYEALLGVGQAGAARDIAKKLIEFDASAATFHLLIQHAGRAGRPETAKALGAEAKTRLSRQEAEALQRLAQQQPTG